MDWLLVYFVSLSLLNCFVSGSFYEGISGHLKLVLVQLRGRFAALLLKLLLELFVIFCLWLLSTQHRFHRRRLFTVNFWISIQIPLLIKRSASLYYIILPTIILIGKWNYFFCNLVLTFYTFLFTKRILICFNLLWFFPLIFLINFLIIAVFTLRIQTLNFTIAEWKCFYLWGFDLYCLLWLYEGLCFLLLLFLCWIFFVIN